ncbi:MAG: signal peptidase II [Pseudomonadota bacterium]
MKDPMGSFLSFLRTPKAAIFFTVAAVMVAADQASKQAVVRNIRYLRESVEVIPGFLALVHTKNPGAAIGIFGDLPVNVRLTIFGVFTVVAVAVILSFLWQLPARDRFQSFTLGLIFSGALGNAIDRAFYEKHMVVDFIRIYTEHEGVGNFLRQHFGTNEYPTFNVADSAIVVGVALFLLRYLFLDDSKEGSDKKEAEELAREGAE